MGRPSRLISTRQRVTAGVIIAVAYGVAASFTRPFTLAADVVTAVPLVGAAVGTVWSIGHPAPVGAADTEPSHGTSPRWRRWTLVWTVPFGAAVAFELYNLTLLPRVRHPTLSALIDSLDSTHVGKTVAFALWLALGWFLVKR